MIYFNSNYQAFAFEIPVYIATVEDNIWQYYAGFERGVYWDIQNNQFVQLRTIEYMQGYQNALTLIRTYKGYIRKTDGDAIKYLLNEISANDWEPIAQQRATWLATIEQLKNEYNIDE